MIVILGESGAGKSTLQKEICRQNPVIKPIVSYTTRSQRPEEKNGIDYNFITNEEFAELVRQNKFLDTATYNGWSYGAAYEDFTDASIAVLTPSGLRTVLRAGIKKVYSIYIDVPRKDRLKKLLDRGDNIEEAYRRSVSDIGMYDGIGSEVTATIKNPNYAFSAEDLASTILKDYAQFIRFDYCFKRGSK